MPELIKYKKPRRLNVVSVSLILVVSACGWLVYQYLPKYVLRQEVYRVLEEHGSTLAGALGRYQKNPVEFDRLKTKMRIELRNVGVNDPEAESWIEIDGQQARLGVVYSQWIHWPFDLFREHEKEYEIEHVVDL